jgi:hypothetical protein
MPRKVLNLKTMRPSESRHEMLYQNHTFSSYSKKNNLITKSTLQVTMDNKKKAIESEYNLTKKTDAQSVYSGVMNQTGRSWV